MVAKNIAAAIKYQYRLSKFTDLRFVPDLYLVQDAGEKNAGEPFTGQQVITLFHLAGNRKMGASMFGTCTKQSRSGT